MEAANDFDPSVSFEKFTLNGQKMATSSGCKIAVVCCDRKKILIPSSLAYDSNLYNKNIEFAPWEPFHQ